MSEYIVIPKDMLEGWDMLSDGELGSIVRTLIRYETTETTKVFTEKHVRACYCSLVAVQRRYEQTQRKLAELEDIVREQQIVIERYEREQQERSERRRGAAFARWGKRDAMQCNAMQSMQCNAMHTMQCNASAEENPVTAEPAPIVEQEELRLESPDEKSEKSCVKKEENKEKKQKKIKNKEILHTQDNSLSLNKEDKGKKESVKKEKEGGGTPGAQGIARGRKLAAKDIAMLYPEEKAAWQEWSKIYPAHRRAPAGPEIMEFVRLKGLVARKDEIFQTILNFQQQDADWKNGYIPRMTKFFKEERYENSPTPEVKKVEKREVVTHYVNQYKPEQEKIEFDPTFGKEEPSND